MVPGLERPLRIDPVVPEDARLPAEQDARGREPVEMLRDAGRGALERARDVPRRKLAVAEDDQDLSSRLVRQDVVLARAHATPFEAIDWQTADRVATRRGCAASRGVRRAIVRASRTIA